MAGEDYSFLLEPPKVSDVFTRVRYYPRSPDLAATTSIEASPATPPPSSAAPPQLPLPVVALGDNRHAATLSKLTTGLMAANSAASETVAPFLSEHIPGQVHIPDNRTKQHADDSPARVYCYRHQPDLRCTRRTPQEDTVAEIQKVQHRQRAQGIPFTN